MKLESLAVKHFCCRHSLKTGGFVVGICFCCVMVAIFIGTMVQLMKMKESEELIYEYPWRNAYGYSITAVFFSVIMLFVDLWFLWGVYAGKPSVILCWVVMTGLWILLCLFLLLSMVTIISVEYDRLYWILSLISGLAAIGFLIYGMLVGFSIWVELKNAGHLAPTPPQTTS